MTPVRWTLTTSVFVLASALAVVAVRYAPEARAQAPELGVPRTAKHTSLRDVGVNDFRLIDAVKRRDQGALAALIRAKANVNAAQLDGATALAWAAHLGERSMVETLLGAGAKVNVVDEYGETPLTLAAANSDNAIIQRLLKAGALLDLGADIRATDRGGNTPLHVAGQAGNLVW
jgi:ankyrin repeat protein